MNESSATMTDQERQTTWVYGVVPAGARLEELKRRSDRLPGDVRVVELGDLAAIVGDAPDEHDAKAIRDQALAHARVLEAAIVDAPVVPFRFGTVNGQVDKDLLAPYHDELAQILERVKDHVQLTLKATYREEVVLREIVTSYPEIAELREQTRGLDEVAARDLRVRLGELVSMALEQVRQRDAASILERLNPLAAASTVGPLESEFMALNAAFLVERQRMRQFEAAAEAVAAEQVERMHFTLLGPMPAYDFIDGGQRPWG
jgi:hypothetical protein